jgi:hypothetical protein
LPPLAIFLSISSPDWGLPVMGEIEETSPWKSMGNFIPQSCIKKQEKFYE